VTGFETRCFVLESALAVMAARSRRGGSGTRRAEWWIVLKDRDAILETSWQIQSGAEGDRYAIEVLARRIALADGYPHAEAMRFAYLASNLALHGGGGTLTIAAESHALTIEARNESGNGFCSRAGAGVGLEAVSRAMDEVKLIEDGGTLVVRARRVSNYIVKC